MKLKSLAVSVVSGKLAQPVGNARARHATRSGLLLRLSDAHGHVGLGEASPLPGYSLDSLEACRAALASLQVTSLQTILKQRSSWLDRLEAAASLLPPWLPAARFGLETALLDLACQLEQTSPFELLGRQPLARLPLNALLDQVGPTSLGRVDELFELGFRTFKLKLGDNLATELAFLTALSQKPELRLRADANRSLRREQACQLLPELAALGLEFLEEPCHEKDWPHLPKRRPAIALDESLQSLQSLQSLPSAQPLELKSLVERSGASVAIVKPMALGGFSHCLALARVARELELELVVTHLFDGPIALRASRVLALIVQSGALAAGLAPHSGLAVWSQKALAVAAAAPASEIVATDFLTHVASGSFDAHSGSA